MRKLCQLVAAFAAALVLTLGAGSARAEIKGMYVDYRHGDTPLSGYLAYDDAVQGRRPAVLLLHDRAGMTPKALEDAKMFARQGYVVFAADMFGKGVLPKTPDEMQALTRIYNMDRGLMRARAKAGLDTLTANAMADASKIAVIGYCFGGTVAVELAETGAPLLGVVPVHGSFRNFQPEAAKNIKGRVLILHGDKDETAPWEEVNKLLTDLRAANVVWQLELYSGAAHGFTTPKSPDEERADREYKASSRAFFAEVFAR